MTTGVQCRTDPRCKEPDPPETGICHCHPKQATKTGATIHRLSRADQVRWPRSRQPHKEVEP